MLIPLSWLKEHLQKNDGRLDAKELGEKLTMRGIAMAGIRDLGSAMRQVVVGRIEAIEKHPNADRLQVTQVVTSDKPDAQKRQIVCGAKNIAVGDIVPVALPGAVLPGDFAIKESQIRGVDSFGMLCSSKELGVADDADGILQLPKSAPLGKSVAAFLGAREEEDSLLEFELTPNRGDCLSVVGIAREAAAVLRTKLREPKAGKFRVSPHRTSSIVKVEVRDTEACPRYVARVLDGMKVGPSPDWIRHRLESVGLRPINNIVDVTNLIMYELGQPLHAFDLRKIESGTIVVDTCKEAAPFTLLNGATVMLEPGDILIQDGDRPIALAGIMGGLNSQVEADTTSIVLESAAFPADRIRRTAKRLGIVSDAAKRYEKGCDLAGVLEASDRAAVLLRDSFSANVYHPPTDTREEGIPKRRIALDMRDVRRFLGLHNLSTETVSSLLESIEIESIRKSSNILSVSVPTFRNDLHESIDIVEEVARLNGYEAIPATEPLSLAIYDRTDTSAYDLERDAKNALVTLGLRETIHMSFTSEEQLSRYGLLEEGAVNLKNPLSEEMRVLRTSLVPSLLSTYQFNRNRKVENQRLFEVSRTFLSAPEEETKVKERLFAAGVIAGHVASSDWTGKLEPIDFFHGKGIVEQLLKSLGLPRVFCEPPTNTRLLHPNRSARLLLGSKEVGFVGELHPFVAKRLLDTTETVVVFEVFLEALRRSNRSGRKFKTPSKFPQVSFDLAFVVDHNVPFGAISETLREGAGVLLRSVDVFDVYEGERLPEGKKSLAYRLVFQAPDRTLADGEATQLRDKLVTEVRGKHGAELRG